jgi:hypothetical protein
VPELIKGANLALRFLLELCALIALGYWGFATGSGAIAKVVLCIGAPLVAAVVWGVFVAPRAPVELPGVLVLLLQVLVFGSAAAGLATTGHRTLALMFAVVVVINAILIYAWGAMIQPGRRKASPPPKTASRKTAYLQMGAVRI